MSMTAATMSYRIETIRPHVIESARTTGFAVGATRVEHLVARGGEPLRCCLRDAEPGEPVMLFRYEPPLPSSPYREAGAVFTHRDRCAGPTSTASYPPTWLGRPQVLRAYDERGWIHDARVHDGDDPERVIAELLADPAVVRIHSRNVAHGCYMFTILPGEA